MRFTVAYTEYKQTEVHQVRQVKNDEQNHYRNTAHQGQRDADRRQLN